VPNLLFEFTATDYLNTPYREALFRWLRTLVVDVNDMRRVAVYRVEHGYEVRIDEYARDGDGRLIITDTEPPVVVRRERVIPFNEPNWPERPARRDEQ
jgi:hypothetical protein